MPAENAIMLTEQNVQSERITQFWDTFISVKFPLHSNCGRQNSKDDSRKIPVPKLSNQTLNKEPQGRNFANVVKSLKSMDFQVQR